VTATGGGMVAIGDDWLTIAAGGGVILLELSGRELVEWLRERREKRYQRELAIAREAVKERRRFPNGSR
jgi:shikimate kinase